MAEHTKTESRDLQPAQDTRVALQQAPDRASDTLALLSSAIERGMSPEALEKLVGLQERILAQNAEREFSAALARFQSVCPEIERRHVVKDRSGRIMYKYAPLEDIVKQVRRVLADCGLSFSFDTIDSESGITIVCTLRHIGGHAEKTQVFIPATKGMNTNASQDRGIQITYGKRYAFTGALGITTADEDTDARSQDVARLTKDQAANVATLLSDSGADKEKFLKYVNAESVDDIRQSDYARAVGALEQKLKAGNKS